MEDMLKYEEYYYGKNCRYICGVDEAGRGPLAGPVYAAAVILPRGLVIEGVNDSKKLSAKKREELFDIIREKAVAYSVASASVEEIESMNILNASKLAMKRAVDGVSEYADMVLVDGNARPPIDLPCETIIRGDALSESIAAASILAKVSRDRYMLEMAEKYPQYGFEKHKGYGTELHRQMILEHGPCEIHRPSFLRKLYEPKEKKRTGRQKTGDRGEALAVRELEKRGLVLVERNFRKEHGEIDIIMRRGDEMHFIEVKTRKIDSLTDPVASMTVRKRKKVIETAERYLAEHDCPVNAVFDYVEVITDSRAKEPYVRIYENCFGGDGRWAY